MFSLTSSHQYFIYREGIDMRKSFDSLCGLIVSQIKRDPLSGEVYIFINKPRNKIKLLHWEPGGFVLYYKRLETGTLELPGSPTGQMSYQLNWSTLVMIIEGISITNIIKRKRYILS
jgi:transposase